MPVFTACSAGPSTVCRIERHQVTIESPTSSTEPLKKKLVQRPHWPAPWNDIG